MPFRLNAARAKVAFVTSARMPSLIYKAAAATGKASNTVYIQHALAQAIARDLGIDVEEILNELPSPKAQAAVLQERTFLGPGQVR